MTSSQEKIRLVVCMGKTCNANGAAEPLYEYLRTHLGEPSNFLCRKQVRWEFANCLGRCEKASNIVFYPMGDWHHHTKLSDMDEIVAQFLEYQREIENG